MKTAVLSTVAVAVAALLVTPAIISSSVEENLDSYVERINAMPFYKAEVVNREFGWLSSSAQVEVGFDFSELAQPDQDVELPDMSFAVNLDFAHAPILNSGLNLSKFSAAVKDPEDLGKLEKLQDMPLYLIEGEMSLGGDLSYRDSSPELRYQDAENGLVVEVAKYSGAAKTVDGVLVHDGLLPRVFFEVDKAKVELNDFAMHTEMNSSLSSYFTLEQVPEYLATMNIANIDFEDKMSANNAKLENLGLEVKTQLDDKVHLVDSEVGYTLGKLNLANGFSAQDLAIVMQLNHIDEDSYLNLNRLFTSESFDFEKDPQIAMAEMGEKVKVDVVNMLKREPQVNIKSLKGTLPQGSFDAQLNTTIVNFESLPENLADPAFWLAHVNANSHIQAAKPLVQSWAEMYIAPKVIQSVDMSQVTQEQVQQTITEQAAGFIGMLEAQKLLSANDNEYLVDFELKDSKAVLNGQAVPLPIPGAN